MNNDFYKKVILTLIAALVFYFIASPLQNCLREPYSKGEFATIRCYQITNW